MYSLTLTHSERKAIDWVGNRYSNGHALADALRECLTDDQIDDEAWHNDECLTLEVPEHVAWRISDIADADHGCWPCFAPALVEKLETFLTNVV